MDSHLRPVHQFQALSRREFLRVAAGAGAVGAGAVLLGACGSDDGNGRTASTPGIVIDPPPETTTIRLPKNLNPRFAPFFLAEQFLPAEGLTNVQYIDSPAADAGDAGLQQLAAGETDIGMPFAADVTTAADAGDPLVILAGVNSSGFVLFGNDGVRSLRDLKGKRLQGKRDDTFWPPLLAYVGIDLDRDVEFVDVNLNNIIPEALAGKFDAWVVTRPLATIFRNANIGHVIVDGMVDPPWSQYFGSMATANRAFVDKHPAATKRALRAILKATDVCAREPERAARYLVDNVSTPFNYDLTLDAMNGQSYAAWREFNPEDTMRFYALRLREAGLVKSTPDELIARATDWHYLEEIKRELGV